MKSLSVGTFDVASDCVGKHGYNFYASLISINGNFGNSARLDGVWA